MTTVNVLRKGKHVEPIKISCGKLRMIMDDIEFFIDKLFVHAPPNAEENEQCSVSNDELPEHMKKIFQSFKDCIALMNYEGSFVHTHYLM